MTRHLDAVAIDDALDLFALLMATRLINPARSASAAERLASLPRLERASRLLAVAQLELVKSLDAAAQAGTGLVASAIWAVLEQVGSREALVGAAAVVEELVPEDDGSAESALRVVLGERYRTVRPFLALLGGSGSLAAAGGGGKVLAAVRALPDLAVRKVKVKPLQRSEIDDELVTPMWQRAVFANPGLAAGVVDRDAYVVCVLEQLHKALWVRDVFAAPSNRWGDPRAQLLDGPAWEAVRPEVLDGFGLTTAVHEHLRGLVTVLDAGWAQLADHLTEAGDTATVRIVAGTGDRMRLTVEHLDALDVPDSLRELRTLTAAMLPRVDLPELLLEVQSWTGFLDAYTHVSGEQTQMQDLSTSVAALLIAEACNVGLVPVTDPNIDALTRGRLGPVDQNYLRAETHAAANVLLITAQAQVPQAQLWGGGLLASVDGLRFVVPVRTLNAGPSPKYFGYKRGLTWLNAVNDQVSGVPGESWTWVPRTIAAQSTRNGQCHHIQVGSRSPRSSGPRQSGR